MATTITMFCPAIDEHAVKNFERQIKAKLPLDYRQFLLRYNGGKPNPSLFRVEVDGFENETSIQRFLCISSEEHYSLSKYLEIYRNRIPNNLLPIAIELSVDLICLSISGEDYGNVYFWDHNWEVTQKIPDYSNIHFLAHSFDDLLKLLYDDEK